MNETPKSALKDGAGLSDAKKVALVIGVMAVVHAITAVSLPVTAGEAYYWLWGKYPAAGYFDHPPMVGIVSSA